MVFRPSMLAYACASSVIAPIVVSTTFGRRHDRLGAHRRVAQSLDQRIRITAERMNRLQAFAGDANLRHHLAARQPVGKKFNQQLFSILPLNGPGTQQIKRDNHKALSGSMVEWKVRVPEFRRRIGRRIPLACVNLFKEGNCLLLSVLLQTERVLRKTSQMFTLAISDDSWHQNEIRAAFECRHARARPLCFGGFCRVSFRGLLRDKWHATQKHGHAACTESTQWMDAPHHLAKK